MAAYAYVAINYQIYLEHSDTVRTVFQHTFASEQEYSISPRYANYLLGRELVTDLGLYLAYFVEFPRTLVYLYSGAYNGQQLNLLAVRSFVFYNLALHDVCVDVSLPSVRSFFCCGAASAVLWRGSPESILLHGISCPIARFRDIMPQIEYVSRLCLIDCQLSADFDFQAQLPHLLELTLKETRVSAAQMARLPCMLAVLDVGGKVFDVQPDLRYLECLREVAMSSYEQFSTDFAGYGAEPAYMQCEARLWPHQPQIGAGARNCLDSPANAASDAASFTAAGLTADSAASLAEKPVCGGLDSNFTDSSIVNHAENADNCSGMSAALLPPSVSKLYYENNGRIRALDLRSLSQLRFLSLKCSDLAASHVMAPAALRVLNLTECGIDELPSAVYFSILEAVFAAGNTFRVCNVEQHANLAEIDISRCGLCEFPQMRGLRRLIRVLANNNNFAGADVAQQLPDSVQSVSLRECDICRFQTDRRFTGLQSLDLRENPISVIVSAFKPLQNVYIAVRPECRLVGPDFSLFAHQNLHNAVEMQVQRQMSVLLALLEAYWRHTETDALLCELARRYSMLAQQRQLLYNILE